MTRYIQLLEDALGHGAKIVGILEIGSFAKGEAVPTSDTDTRVYVTLPAAYLFNELQTAPDAQLAYGAFTAQYRHLPRQDYNWPDFNIPEIKRISAQLGCNIHFGLADQRYVAFELAHLDQFASLEHSFLFQSNILYDPQHFLTTVRTQLHGKVYPTLVQLYTTQHLARLTPRIYEFLEPHPVDEENLAWSGQIEWVNMAVRCVRNAVAAKSYNITGVMLYKKPDILRFYQDHLPDEYALVEQLYTWKTDAQVRAELAQSFALNPTPHFATFRSLMPQLAALVTKVGAL
ncbi:MAG: hypothetical protein U0350_31230 [Caldilineaceae bacterium]